MVMRQPSLLRDGQPMVPEAGDARSATWRAGMDARAMRDMMTPSKRAFSDASSGSNSQASTATTSAIFIPITAPVGGVQFTQPPQTAAASFYKIASSQLITFGWNLTSLFITPSQLTVSAFCSANGNTYPVGPTDGVIPGTATQVVWGPYSYQTAHPQQPLIIASYTLQVMDAHGLTGIPAPGRFAANSEMTFALYKPQTYTPLASWTCSGCSGASLSAVAPPVVISLIVTFFAMLLGGWGVLRRR
ncbi:hypothetical protein JB92DRAFT_3120405 [Gautieria morchelliformis]|nr:hypothetical protein JB92DRAFT_3120405 [Gautieria morchelliformis]